MGREVRRVPADWEHPRDRASGRYIPMYKHPPTYTPEEIEEGLCDGWLSADDGPPNWGCDVMPQWTDEQRTHWQMYEDTSEGTPISPVLPSADALARWLADNGASAFGSMACTYEQWLAMIEGQGHSIGMVIEDGRML